MAFTAEFIIFLLIVEFGSYFIKGIAGFGDALISPPLLSLTEMKPSEISPMNIFLNLPMNFYLAFTNRKSYSAKKMIPMIIFNLIGLVPGIICLKYASSWIVKAALGLVIIFVGIEMLTRKEAKEPKRNPVIMAMVALVSGFIGGMFGISILIAAYIERTGYVNRSQFRGEVCFVFFVENIARLILYAVVGFYTADILKMALIAAIGGFAGMFVGQRIDTKLSEATVKKIVIAVFMCAGVSVLIRAILFRS